MPPFPPLPQTAKQQATVMLWAAAGMAFILIVLYALWPDQQSIYLAEYYKSQIEQGGEEEALEAVHRLPALKDYGMPVLVEALSSPHPGVIAAARKELLDEMNGWEMLPARTAAPKYNKLVGEMVEQSSHFHSQAHDAVYDVAMRITEWKGLDEQANKPELLAECTKIMGVSGRNGASASVASNRGLFPQGQSLPGTNAFARNTNTNSNYGDTSNEGNHASSNPAGFNGNHAGASIGPAPDGLSGPHGKGSTHPSTFAQTDERHETTARAADNNLRSHENSMTTPNERPAWAQGSGFAKDDTTDRRNNFAPMTNPGSDIVRMSQLPGGNLPVAPNSSEPNRIGASLPAGNSIGLKNEQPAPPSSNPFLNVGNGPNGNGLNGNAPTGTPRANGPHAGGPNGALATDPNHNPPGGPRPAWPPEQGANSAASLNGNAGTISELAPQMTPLKAQPVSLNGSGTNGSSPVSATSIGEVSELMKQLQSGQPAVVENAKAELTRRNFTPQQIEIARSLYDPNPAVRAQLAEALPKMNGVDAKPWLMTLSQDADPNVRFAAAGVMASCSDPDLRQRVEELGRTDSDPRIQQLAQRLKTSK
ncbi:MAG TPA: HEAT repeat domain-containing protein [Pirellulales bacterium]|jgi:hypothetical protein|nr:HEAT repeat domain-containing protein [Pirellulales bacterium]